MQCQCNKCDAVHAIVYHPEDSCQHRLHCLAAHVAAQLVLVGSSVRGQEHRGIQHTAICLQTHSVESKGSDRIRKYDSLLNCLSDAVQVSKAQRSPLHSWRCGPQC